MYKDGRILIGKSGNEEICIYPKMANRHGLIAGATGTGKTVTLKVLAESFSDAGVSVFLGDAKGDLSGMSLEGEMNESISGRIESMGIEDFSFKKYPTTYWDVYQEQGIPLRTTISEMGPLLLSRILELNDTQAQLLTIVFKIADDEGMILTDTKDLKSMLNYVGEKSKEYSAQYGNIAKQSLAVIIRAVVALESAGGEMFFGEPALNIKDWIGTDENGRGKISVLECDKLMQSPVMYATFLLWMISELYEILPEVGDLEKPRMVFFFDEAHMLFENASKALLEKVEQVVKLIRSKGVGIYFVTQNPRDIPDGVLSQLGNKIQHALHAYTPADQKNIRAAAQAFRVNPEFDTEQTLETLGVGEALVSVLDLEGVPTVVQKAKILPPQSRMGAIDAATRDSMIKSSNDYVKYSEYVDNDSAYEFLERMHADEAAKAEQAALDAANAKEAEKTAKEQAKAEEKAARDQAREAEREAKKKKTAAGNVAKSAASTIGREMGSTLGKTVGGSFGKKLGGNVGSSLGRGLLSTFLKL